MTECKTLVSEKLIVDFNIYGIKKKLWFPFAAMAFLVIIGIIVAFDKDLGLIGGIVLIAIGALMPPFYWLLACFLMKKNVKNSTLLRSETTQTFTFDDKIYISEQSKFVNSNQIDIAWDMLIKAVETSTAFYLYISKVQAFLVDKTSFTVGSAKDLHDELKNILGKKLFSYPKKLYNE